MSDNHSDQREPRHRMVPTMEERSALTAAGGLVDALPWLVPPAAALAGAAIRQHHVTRRTEISETQQTERVRLQEQGMTDREAIKAAGDPGRES